MMKILRGFLYVFYNDRPRNKPLRFPQINRLPRQYRCPISSQLAKNKTCPSCGKALTCSALDPKQDCWCMQIPAILPPEPRKDCLCPTCLAKAVAQHITLSQKSKSLTEMIELARPYRDDNDMHEHLDYTMENGMQVFRSWVHLKRGSCCGNGCRNCPYPTTNTQ